MKNRFFFLRIYFRSRFVFTRIFHSSRGRVHGHYSIRFLSNSSLFSIMDGENEWEARGSRGTTRDDKNQLNPGGLEENKMRAFSTVTIKKTEIRNDK